MRAGRWLVVLGSLTLFCAALLHGSGYASVTHALEKSSASPLFVSSFKALWLMVSFHFVILSLAFVVGSRMARGRQLVLLCALIPAADTLLLFRFIGVFVGTILLAIATLLFLGGGFLLANGSQR